MKFRPGSDRMADRENTSPAAGHEPTSSEREGEGRRVQGQVCPPDERPQGSTGGPPHNAIRRDDAGGRRAKPVVGGDEGPSQAVGQQVSVPELAQDLDLPGQRGAEGRCRDETPPCLTPTLGRGRSGYSMNGAPESNHIKLCGLIFTE